MGQPNLHMARVDGRPGQPALCDIYDYGLLICPAPTPQTKNCFCFYFFKIVILINKKLIKNLNAIPLKLDIKKSQ